MADSSQLTRDGSSWERPVQNYVILTGISNSLIWGRGFFKKHGEFLLLYGGCVYTIEQVNFASDDPFKRNLVLTRLHLCDQKYSKDCNVVVI